MKLRSRCCATLAAIATLLLTTIPMNAQQKLFTLEDLNFGGKNYRNMVPESRMLTWWGDELLHKDGDVWYTVDKRTFREKPLAGKRLQDFEAQRQPQQWEATNRDNNLCVVSPQGDTLQLTTDGSRQIVYGQPVHRNEWGIDEGVFWNPDRSRMAFYRMDQSLVADYPQVDISARIAEYQPDKYPMAGCQSHTVTVGIYDVKKNKTVYLHTPVSKDTAPVVEGETFDNIPVYFTNIAWSPDGKTLYMFELNRAQNDCRLMSYDAETGEPLKEICREQSTKYVEPLHPIAFLPWDDTKFIMQSQRDGYNHLYVATSSQPEKEAKLRQLTSGSWVVMDIIGFCPKTHSIIIASNEIHPTQRNIFAVNVDTGKRTRLDNGRGWHYGELSPSGEWIIDRYSEPDVPRNIEVYKTSTPNPHTSPYFSAPDPWQGYQQPAFVSGSIKAADGTTDLYYRMVKPHDFDPAKKYPTVVYVYGGPHAHNVDARWHYASRSWETYMAQKGYIVFILDNRGSENRGRDFEQATFHQLGQVEMQDQMEGVKFLKSLPYVDADRLGVHGWSFGGFMTISLMTNYPDVFKVGVAGGPVIDWKWYEVMYGERYMGTPQDNPDGYAKTSLLTKAKDLKGRLQIITGYNDETVVPQHCLSFLKECTDADTQPDFFAYPGEHHNMMGHRSVHLHERITRYFEDFLK